MIDFLLFTLFTLAMLKHRVLAMLVWPQASNQKLK